IAAGPQANFFADIFNYNFTEISSRSFMNYTLGLAANLHAEFAVSDSTAFGIGAEFGYDPLAFASSFSSADDEMFAIRTDGYTQYRLHPYIFLQL
ncbi:MAG: hypothetical protein ACOC0D_10905, partial [Spirochaeta sp.]